MPPIHRPGRPRRPSRPRRSTGAGARAPKVVVLGDLMLDVVLNAASPLEVGTDVPGHVAMVQGGSAANTARWLGRLGAKASLIAAVGRDGAGRALVEAVKSDRVMVRVLRVAGVRTGRIGVLVSPDGERSFVADRGAADRLAPDDLRASWFEGADALHLPIYSLLGDAARPGRPAGDRARARGGRDRQHRPGLDRTAAGGGPPDGPRAHRRGRPGPPVRDRLGSGGAPWASRRRGPARVRTDRRRQARGEGRDRADTSRRASPNASRSPRSTCR